MAFTCIGLGSASARTVPLPGVAWSGDLSTGDLSQWSFVQQCPGAISVVGSPAAPGARAVALSVSDNDTESACPNHVFTPNPAAGLIGPSMFHDGDDAYIGFSTLFPTGFPFIPHWFQFAEIYGKPYGGSPPLGLDVVGNRFGLWRDATHGYDNPWSVPLQTNAWQDLVLHVKFSADPTVGFVEIWLNGVQQTFGNGQQRLYMATLVPGINWSGAGGADYLDLDQYRSKLDAFGRVTIYHAAARIGDSFAAVEPSMRLGIAPAPSWVPSPAPAPRPLARSRTARARRTTRPGTIIRPERGRKASRRHHHRHRHHRRHRRLTRPAPSAGRRSRQG